MSQPGKHLYEFGEFRLDTAEHLLSRDGTPISLTPKAFELLLVLVKRSGHLIGKEELLQQVWPDSFVEESNLTFNISALRKALNDGQSNLRYIETVPKRGYRFAAEVRKLATGDDDLVIEHNLRARIVTEAIAQASPTEKILNVDASDWVALSSNDERAVLQIGEQLAAHPPISQSIRFDSRATHLLSASRLRRNRLWLMALAASVVLGAAEFLYSHHSPLPPSKGINSIAVLPFTNVNADADAEFLSDGVTESVINSLSTLPNLKVMSRNSVFRYKGREIDAWTVGRELGVQAVLTGRVWQRDDELSISVELINTQDNSLIWGEQHHQRLTHILDLQEDISTAISQSLRVQLTGTEQQKMEKRYTENPEAYQLYLKGRFFWNKRSAEGLKRGIDYFQQAIDKDPKFALAYSGLADCYTILYDYQELPPEECVPQAKAAVVKALELDESLAEAHTSRGYLVWLYDHDRTDAEKEFLRAIELNPNYSTAHHWYGFYLATLRRFDESMREMKRAQDLDPLSLIINSNMGRVLYFEHQYDQAIEQLQKTIEMDQSFSGAHYNLATAYEGKGMYAEAVREYQKWRTLDGNSETAAAMGEGYKLSGYQGALQKWLGSVENQSKLRPIPPYASYAKALIYAKLNDKDQAFFWLNKVIDERASRVDLISVVPVFDFLHDDPRWADLLRRL